jgi:DNA-binding NtrC family response regulator
MLKPPKQAPRPESFLEEFVLACDTMKNIMDVVRQVAGYDVNILITGESGTGKEMLAKIIHLQSHRAKNAFIPVNCGVLSGLLFEDKLFGHEKGAFTGAVDRKKGCFELADGGTLFLDEIGELPLENQVDFLRVLEDFRFNRIGGHEQIQVDVRIIAATNAELRNAVRDGRFREDLFYRLQVVPIHLPPLRERREVIPRMLDYFLTQFSAIYHKPKPSAAPEVLNILRRHEWPGNVRELKNLVERVSILNDGTEITRKNLPSDFLFDLQSPADPVMDLAQVRQEAETEAIRKALFRTGGDRERASRLLCISPRTLRHKCQQYGIRVDRSGETALEPPPE